MSVSTHNKKVEYPFQDKMVNEKSKRKNSFSQNHFQVLQGEKNQGIRLTKRAACNKLKLKRQNVCFESSS
jgi:hypothetical protein